MVYKMKVIYRDFRPYAQYYQINYYQACTCNSIINFIQYNQSCYTAYKNDDCKDLDVD